MYEGKPTVFDAFTSHEDEVTHVGPGTTVLCGNAWSAVQATHMALPHGGVFWGVQYHPEYDLHELARLTFARAERLTGYVDVVVVIAYEQGGQLTLCAHLAGWGSSRASKPRMSMSMTWKRCMRIPLAETLLGSSALTAMWLTKPCGVWKCGTGSTRWCCLTTRLGTPSSEIAETMGLLDAHCIPCIRTSRRRRLRSSLAQAEKQNTVARARCALR